MKKRVLGILLAALALLALAACGQKNTEPTPPPDLTGEWTQVGGEGTNFYQICTITDDTIECYWHVTSDDSEYLYWTGSFEPPETGEEPYSWTSVNDLKRAKTSNWALRDESKTFTYKKGQLSYIVSMGNLRMTVALEKVW